MVLLPLLPFQPPPAVVAVGQAAVGALPVPPPLLPVVEVEPPSVFHPTPQLPPVAEVLLPPLTVTPSPEALAVSEVGCGHYPSTAGWQATGPSCRGQEEEEEHVLGHRGIAWVEGDAGGFVTEEDFSAIMQAFADE